MRASILKDFQPALLTSLKNYNREKFMADLMAGVLVVVAYNMSEWRSFISLSKQSRETFIVLMTTFLLTVIFDLTIAIAIGLLLSVFIFMKRMNESTTISQNSGKLDVLKGVEYDTDNLKNSLLHIPKGVEVYEIEGPFFFGVANKFDDLTREMGDKPKVRIIRMRKVPFMDSTGINNLEMLCRRAQKERIQIVLSGVNESVSKRLYKSHVPDMIGKENICNDIHHALERADELINPAEAH